MRYLWILLLAVRLLPAAVPLEERIEALIAASPAARHAFWGIQIVNLATGATLYQKGQDRFFVPASNTKLFTTALALMRLGPDHRFRTVVMAEEEPDSSGRLKGDLRLIGGGDPTLSAREIPYKKGPISGNPLKAIEELADQIIARGVRRVEGNVVGDDTAYIWEPYPEGWAQDDAVWEYGAPVSALTINDNSLTLSVIPGGRAGEPAQLLLSPPLEYYVIDNRVLITAGKEGKIRIDRMPGSEQIRVWGAIPQSSPARTYLLAIDDPALYGAAALRDALTRRGVVVSGEPVARHRLENDVLDLKEAASPPAPAGGVELARRISPPVVESLRIINKVSQNLQAELMLREVGRVRRNLGSRQAGLEELKAFLAEVGLAEDEYNLEDGSGLSRLNLIAPAAVVKLLLYMYRSRHRDAWFGLLPVGGTDGTLSYRFENQPAEQRIRGKTGTLSHVSALSGYLETGRGEPMAFSILVNNYNAPASEIRGVIDRIVRLMLR